MTAADVTIAQAVSAADRAACLELRLAVFVAEQAVPLAIEQDAYEDVAVHFLACAGHTPAGTARVVFLDNGGTAKVGRVAVRHDWRGRGVGTRLMKAIETHPALAAAGRLYLEAQIHAIGFYTRLGYVASGAEFMDAGIPHRAMAKLRRTS